jgi:hypothetical protein
MRRKPKDAKCTQESKPLPPNTEQVEHRAKAFNALDLHLIAHLKSASGSLEPVGPLAGKKFGGPRQNQSLDTDD